MINGAVPFELTVPVNTRFILSPGFKCALSACGSIANMSSWTLAVVLSRLGTPHAKIEPGLVRTKELSSLDLKRHMSSSPSVHESMRLTMAASDDAEAGFVIVRLNDC